MKRKTLNSERELRARMRKMPRKIEAALVGGMRRTAQFGAAAVARSEAQASPRPYATGQYHRSWAWKPRPDGAVLGNSSKQSYWVEAGRKPGKQPPVVPLVEWVRVKRLAKRRGAGTRKKRQSRTAVERAIAFAVARKIAREGTKPRWVLRRAMPVIGKRAVLDSLKALKQIQP